MNEYSQVKGIVVCNSKITYTAMKRDDGIGCLTAMYDTHKLGKIYMPTIRKRQDWALWLDILSRCKISYGLKEPLAYYRIRQNSISKKKITLVKYNLNVYRTVLKYSLPKAYLFFFFIFLPTYFLKKLKEKWNSL